MRSAGSSLAAAALLLAGAAAGACKTAEGLPEVQGGVELGLRRGAGWSTLTVKPPYVIGPRVNLQLKRGAFSGTIDGRAVSLQIDATGVRGMGPVGQVAFEIEEGPDRLVVGGTWNGSRVHFEITSEALRGTIAVSQSPRFTEVVNCQYVLDKVQRDGSRSGMSICAGLPEDTLIEIPPAVQGWLTRQELVVVLLALLSAPPITSMETNSPLSM